MFIRVLFASIFGAAIAFGWGFVFWAQSGLPQKHMKTLPREDERAVLALLGEKVPATGSYFMPLEPKPDAEDFAAFKELHEKGPIVHLQITKAGAPVLDRTTFNKEVAMEYGQGLAHYFVSALLLSALLAMAAPALPSYLGRLFFLTVCGLFAAVFVRLNDPVWFHHPWEFDLVNAGYAAVTWFIAGIIMAAIVRAKPEIVVEVKKTK